MSDEICNNDHRRAATPRTESLTVGELVAWQIVAWPAATLILAAVLFWVDIPVGPYHLWAGLLLVLLTGSRLTSSLRAWLTASAWLAFVTLIAGAALGWLYDFSGDGQWYHLPGILALSEGWNPFQLPQLSEWDPEFEKAITSGIFVQHYAKGPWIIAAAAYQATGMLEAAKVFNLLYCLAVYLLAARFSHKLGLSRIWSHALALAAAANPVNLYQMTSFFVDGQLASLCALLILLSLDYFRQQRPQVLILMAASVILLANVKFTGLVYAVCLGGSLIVLAWVGGWRVEVRRYAMTGVASILLAVLLTGYQPYVTNFLQQGNPFYPVVGMEDGRNVQWKMAPAEFMAMNRVEKLTRSVFAQSSGARSMPVWKPPFTVTKNELYIFFNAEPRYGGFGPLFGSILLITLAVYPLARKITARKVWGIGAGLAIIVVLSMLPNPEAWWARLSPQLWLVPVILASAMALGATAWSRRIAAILVLLLLVNSTLVAILNWGRALEKNLVFREQVSHLQAISSTQPLDILFHASFQMLTEYRLRALAIPYQPTEVLSCATPARFSYPESAQAAACLPP